MNARQRRKIRNTITKLAIVVSAVIFGYGYARTQDLIMTTAAISILSSLVSLNSRPARPARRRTTK